MAGALCLFLACNPDAHSNPHDSDQPAEAEHAHEDAAALSFTRWTEQVELFVAFQPLVAGETIALATHFTQLPSYKPLREATLTVTLEVGEKEVEQTLDGPASPGFFNPVLTPPISGMGVLTFVLTTPEFTEQMVLDSIRVFDTREEATVELPAAHAPAEEVEFLKEQAWSIEFSIAQAQRGQIHEVIRTSGVFQPVQGEEKVLSAKSSGIVFFNSNKLQQGREVQSGEALFTVNSQGLVEANLEEKYQVAKARLEKARSDFERAEDLLAEQIIGRKEYERRKMEHSVAKAAFQTLKDSYRSNGQTLRAPLSGVLKEIMVSEGQFVREGAPLARITNSRRVLLRAEVSQKYLPQLSRIVSANFRTSYQSDIQPIEKYNGRLLTYGKLLEPGEHFIPVLFELDNLGQLMPGSFAELHLLVDPAEEALLVPRSALMRDYDQHYVYVQTGGEHFEKRPVQLGVDDGFQVQIRSGISEGEWVVTQGAYQLKMASMSSAIPAHGHTH